MNHATHFSHQLPLPSHKTHENPPALPRPRPLCLARLPRAHPRLGPRSPRPWARRLLLQLRRWLFGRAVRTEGEPNCIITQPVLSTRLTPTPRHYHHHPKQNKQYVLNASSDGWISLQGIPIPIGWACWAELFLTSLISPNASFLGHLCGAYSWVFGGVHNPTNKTPGPAWWATIHCWKPKPAALSLAYAHTYQHE